MARVAVCDMGPGLSEADKARVWERYPHIEAVTVQSGSGVSLGLGLHISKTIIERHGGEVGVESVPSRGSTFWFTLPLITITTLAASGDAAVGQPLDRYDLLTSREREVLQLAAQGLGTAEIGERLTISPRTAETHRANLLRKLGLETQTDLVRFAISRGLVSSGSSLGE